MTRTRSPRPAALAAFGDRARVVHGGFEDLAEIVVRQRTSERGEHRGNPVRPGCEQPAARPTGARLLVLGRCTARHAHGQRAGAHRRRGASTSTPRRDSRRCIARTARSASPVGSRARIVARRPLQTTGDLVDAVKAAVPGTRRAARGGHPARRTFQAIRMEVNRELPNLASGLDESVHLLAPGGRILVLAYHSLEDRIVKQRFAAWSGRGEPQPPGPARGAERRTARADAHPPAAAPARRRGRRQPARRERASACGREARRDRRVMTRDHAPRTRGPAPRRAPTAPRASAVAATWRAATCGRRRRPGATRRADGVRARTASASARVVGGRACSSPSWRSTRCSPRASSRSTASSSAPRPPSTATSRRALEHARLASPAAHRRSARPSSAWCSRRSPRRPSRSPGDLPAPPDATLGHPRRLDRGEADP